VDLDPTSFSSSATNGTADSTGGQLNFAVKGTTNSLQTVGIDSISISDAGDYTLSGIGTSATKAQAGAIMRVTVTEVDGVAITPVNLIPVNSSVSFNLAANSGIVQPWSLGLSMNIDAQLTNLNIPFTVGATKLEVVIDNDLSTLSESSSLAFIAKKGFRVNLVPDNRIVPEPSMLGLAGLAILALARRR
jgi:hypothetical protein